MKRLRLKIPPPIIAILSGLIIWGVSESLPAYILNGDIRQIIALIILAMAGAIDAWALISFRMVKTTIDPRYPHKTSAIVSHGIYAYTRNPMYLGLVLILSSLSIYLGTVFGLIVVVLFILYMNSFQIVAEEEALEQQFGDAYLNYKNSVRRWL